MKRIRTGDEVIVTTGKDKGRRGEVIGFKSDDRVLVRGLNLAKKHVRPNPQAGIEGGIVELEMGIHLSNVMLWNAATSRGERVGFKVLEDGRKVRVFKSNGEVVDA